MYPTIYPFQTTPYMAQTQPQNIQYVNNKASVDSYPMGPNSSVILMDSNLPRFYTKHTDASGVATIKSFDFKETEEDKPAEYVTKQEFEKFKATMKGAKHESANEPRKQQ